MRASLQAAVIEGWAEWLTILLKGANDAPGLRRLALTSTMLRREGSLK